LRGRGFLGGEEVLPEVVGEEGLCDAGGSEVGVGPGCFTVAVFKGPIALVESVRGSVFWSLGGTYIPCWGSISGFCYIMISFSMTSHFRLSDTHHVIRGMNQHTVKNLILNIQWSLTIKSVNMMFESLPLSQLSLGIKVLIRIIISIYETEVFSSLEPDVSMICYWRRREGE
jgi:hypothetical protein